MKLCSSSPSFCASQVSEELCKGDGEKERESERSPEGRKADKSLNREEKRQRGAKKRNKGCVCVCHCGLAIYIKNYLKAKEEEFMETQIFISP
jgi:hypothetical protein